MKKLIIIYFIGVIVGWIMGFNYISDFKSAKSKPITYGDITLNSLLSLASWANVIALGAIYISDSEFWDTPINNQ